MVLHFLPGTGGAGAAAGGTRRRGVDRDRAREPGARAAAPLRAGLPAASCAPAAPAPGGAGGGPNPLFPFPPTRWHLALPFSAPFRRAGKDPPTPPRGRAWPDVVI